MKNNYFKILKTSLSLILLLGFIGCQSDSEEDLGNIDPADVLKSSYTIDRFKVLNIVP